MPASTAINVLEYLRSRTQVDLDALDVEAAKKGALGVPYTDATSNPIDIFFQLQKPENLDVIHHSISLARDLGPRHPSLSSEELAVEIAGAILAARMLPYIKGDVHVMANPHYAFDSAKLVETGRRYHSIFRDLDAGINLSRVIMKVPATWEGLQACKLLKSEGHKTLGTTIFSMEQCILAGEVGCVSVSPFVHDLKQALDASYKDADPLFDICVQAQKYYEQHALPTRVKACGAGSVDGIMQLAGVAAHTIELADINAMSTTERAVEQLQALSLFQDVKTDSKSGVMGWPSYLGNEAQFRLDLAASKSGKSQLKLYQAIDLFSDFQRKDEEIFMESRS